MILALAILVLPWKWMLACCLSVTLHELFHLIALRFVFGKWMPIHAFSRGIKIYIPNISPQQELFCTLAGPVGSFLLTLTYPYFPSLAICALVQGVYNMLPIYPLDGGRAICCLTDIFLPRAYALWLTEYIAYGCIGASSAVAIFATVFYNWGVFPIIMLLILFWKQLFGKNTCKHKHFALE